MPHCEVQRLVSLAPLSNSSEDFRQILDARALTWLDFEGVPVLTPIYKYTSQFWGIDDRIRNHININLYKPVMQKSQQTHYANAKKNGRCSSNVSIYINPRLRLSSKFGPTWYPNCALPEPQCKGCRGFASRSKALNVGVYLMFSSWCISRSD